MENHQFTKVGRNRGTKKQQNTKQPEGNQEDDNSKSLLTISA